MTRLEQPSEILLGSKASKFAGCNETTLCRVDKSLNFRVDVHITKPLWRAVLVQVGGKPIWIRFKYVKLPDFCYACGKRGHLYKGCDLFNEAIPKSKLQYGGWPRALLLKPRGENSENELLEERSWCRLSATRMRRTRLGRGLFLMNQLLIKKRERGRMSWRWKIDEAVRLLCNPALHNESSLSQLHGDPTIVENLRNLLRRKSLRLVFLSETKLFGREMNIGKNRLGFFEGDKSLKVTLMSNSLNHIDVQVEGLGVDSHWHFTGIYGWPENTVSDDRRREAIVKAWNEVGAVNAWDNLQLKLRSCVQGLLRWHDENIRDVKSNIMKLEQHAEEESDIEHEVSAYFARLFSSEGSSRYEEVLAFV
ncbi:hypothetical protein Cgig2_005967 [Carnegiea gigantea]|uniref:CCHC-type domain-containing protein n=1 Tax=Carnegiea gigantea TaxID=171969 RepID=A0A9Q1KK58_9CARY|nr:hypothetical protein Cgig2_005967 [Carnegiea gigantea]